RRIRPQPPHLRPRGRRSARALPGGGADLRRPPRPVGHRPHRAAPRRCPLRRVVRGEGAEKFPQNLYIAPMADPCTLAGERRLISAPEHDWEMTVAAVNEAPEILRNPEQGKLFIVYSADASWTPAYKRGLLEWQGGDVL